MPTFPGLPPLAQGFQPPAAPQQLTSDTASAPGGANIPQWGLYKDGAPVIVADNVVALGFRGDGEISDYPVEKGGFLSYDKVQLPNEPRVRFSTGGSIADRTALLNSVDAAKKSLDVFDLVMPEITYPSINVVNYSYDRSNGRYGLLAVELHCEEIRQTVVAAFSSTPGTKAVSNARTPGSNNAQSGGNIATTPVSPAQLGAVGPIFAPGSAAASSLNQPIAGH